MRLLILLFAISLEAQVAPRFPTNLVTYNDIGLASENFTTTLSSAAALGATVLNVNTTAGALVPTIIYVDPNTAQSESFFCISKTATSFTACTAGFNGTTQRTHNNGAAVANNVSPFYTNRLAAETIAMQTALLDGTYLTPALLYPLIYSATPVDTSIAVFTGNNANSKIAPSSCTISGQTITCPATTSSSVTISVPTHFAALGTATQGKIVYCDDCNVASPCTGSGSGAWGFANGSAWKCPF